MRRFVQLSGLALAALTATACVAGPGATTAPTTPPTATPTVAPTAVPSGTPGTPTIEHPTGKDSLVLRITIDGGFVPVGYALTTLPVLSIYGDGRVIVQGAVPAIYPGPALTPLWVHNITEAGLQKVLAAAAEAGLLGADKQYDDGGLVADAPTTTFILNAGGRVHTISAYALFEGETPGPNLSKEDAEARKRLQAFLEAVTNLPELVGASELTAEHEYRPHAIRLFVGDYGLNGPRPTDLPLAWIPWPLETPLATYGEPVGQGKGGGLDLRCGVVEGADLDQLLPFLKSANLLTPWTSADKDYSFLVRPLLPDESDCVTV